MNDARPADPSASFEVHVAAKDYVAASGARQAVLRDIRLSLAAGEIGVILGPSGCGKTTLLRIVAGLDRHFTGMVRLPPGDEGRAPRIGMVFQEPRLLPWRTVEENVRLGAPGASATALDRLFQAFDLAEHRRHRPGELSLGLARRVAVARAFAIEPDLLLLDEPFVSLDAALAAKLRAVLADLVASERVTTLIVTHDLDGAMLLADQIFVLSPRPGRLIGQARIDMPRQRRGPAQMAAIRRDLAGQLRSDASLAAALE